MVGATGSEPTPESQDKPGHTETPAEIAGIKDSMKKILEQGQSRTTPDQTGTENQYQIRIKKIAELIDLISRMSDEEMDDLMKFAGYLEVKSKAG